MKNFTRYKVNCSEAAELMSNEKGYRPVTDDDWAEFKKILDKIPQYITERQKQTLKDHVLGVIEDQNPPLSTSVRKTIYKHYAYGRFGVSQVSAGGKSPISLSKGEIAEPDAIKILSKRDGVDYKKNEKLFSNKFFKGIPDIVLYDGDKIIGVKDIKVPIDLISFLERVDGDHLADDRWEMLAYLDVLNLKQGEICYVLVDMPDSVKDIRLREARERYTSYGYEPSHIKRLIKGIERSMVYDYIPEEQKIQRFTVTRQGYFTSQMRKRVKSVRERMALLHEKFEKGLILPESNHPSGQENIS